MSYKPFIARSHATYFPRSTHHIYLWILALILELATPSAKAVIQFDAFLGYDGLVRELNWFPVVFEVLNDGPSFHGSIELSGSQFSAGQSRRILAEFPTNTRLRFVMPAFASSRSMMWTARLMDDRGKVRGEQPNLRPKRDIGSRGFLLGAIPRTFGGMPALPESTGRTPEIAPAAANLRVEQFPDNPISLEGLDAIYLNSEKALELKAPQANALVRWVHQGGHLLVSIEQPGDIISTPWLRDLMPIEVSSVANQTLGSEILKWMRQGDTESSAEPNPPTATSPTTAMSPAMMRRYGLRPGTSLPSNPATASAASGESPWAKLPESPAWENSSVGIATGTLIDGKVILAMDQTPLIVSAARDRGQITVLLFNPEREPFRAWNLRAWLWARLAQVPRELLRSGNTGSNFGGWSIDGVLGAMIDSKQVHKLPISWLLTLLALYLAVIGPVDRIVLKKLNKQMWTWVTFPVYVAAFSLLIYFISYKLRSGESELNNLHFVDVYPHGGRAELRGRTFFSVYSPANAQFPFSSEQTFSSLRGESQGSFSGGYEGSRADIEQFGDNFRAQVYVPVWTSQLFVNDWWQSGPLPLAASITRSNAQFLLNVTNLSGHPLTDTRLLFKGSVFTVGEILPSKPLTIDISTLPFIAAREFKVQNGGQQFQVAVSERRQAFRANGNAPTQWNLALGAMAVSLLNVDEVNANSDPNNYMSSFLAPSGLDLSPLGGRGQALLLAWDAGQTLAKPTHQFKPIRFRQDTLLRLAMPIPDTP